jgi:hypothetical protein
MRRIRPRPWGTSVLLALVPALCLAAPARAQEAKGARELQELEKRIQEEQKSWRAFRAEAAGAEERAALIEAFPKDELAAELQALAAGARGTEVAARAWMHVLRLGSMLDDRALFERALERLLAEHLQSQEIAGLTLELTYGVPEWSAPLAADALRKILAGNPTESVQANGLAQLALLVGLDPRFGAAGRAEAETLLARIEKEYTTADFIGMTGAQFAAGARHEMNHLRVGQVAPDFEVTDQEGAKFRLSDYRGRVVVLDFWGFV